MKIVIDIPSRTYERILSNKYDYGDMNIIIQNGTPLPKHHGRLADVDEIIKYFHEKVFIKDANPFNKFFYKDVPASKVVQAIKEAPTIIERSVSE